MAKQEFSAMRLSRNFTLKEFEVSDTAEKLGIDNRVPTKLVPSVKALVDEILQPIRDKVEIPIHVSSGYRCKQVNAINAYSSEYSDEVDSFFIAFLRSIILLLRLLLPPCI